MRGVLPTLGERANRQVTHERTTGEPAVAGLLAGARDDHLPARDDDAALLAGAERGVRVRRESGHERTLDRRDSLRLVRERGVVHPPQQAVGRVERLARTRHATTELVV